MIPGHLISCRCYGCRSLETKIVFHRQPVSLQIGQNVTSEGRLIYCPRGENEPSPSAESKESLLYRI